MATSGQSTSSSDSSVKEGFAQPELHHPVHATNEKGVRKKVLDILFGYQKAAQEPEAEPRVTAEGITVGSPPPSTAPGLKKGRARSALRRAADAHPGEWVSGPASHGNQTHFRELGFDVVARMVDGEPWMWLRAPVEGNEIDSDLTIETGTR